MRFLKFIILQALLVIIFAFVIEGAGQFYFILKHGYSFRESLMYAKDEKLVYKLNPEYKGKDVMHNGFRGESFPGKKTENTFRIIAIGGSTTWGANDSYRNSWPFQLNLLLNENAPEKVKYEVINAGVSGYGSAQHYVRLKEELLNLHPDMVIIYSGWNMVGSLDNNVYYWVPDNVVKPDSQFTERIAAFLTDNSVIFAKLRVLFPGYLDAFDPGISRQERLDSGFEELAEKHKSYLVKIVRLTQENNITPVLITYPQICGADLDKDDLSLLKTRFPEIYEHREYLNRRYGRIIGKIKETADENGVLLIDTSKPFDELPYEKKLDLFVDRMHLAKEGFPVQARAIYESLKENNALWRE